MKSTLIFLSVLVSQILTCEYKAATNSTKCVSMQFEKNKPITLSKYGKKLDLSMIKGGLYKDTFLNMPKMIELTIRSSGLTFIEEGFLDNLLELETLTIKINHGFPNITKGLFGKCCQNLKTLRIYDNNVKLMEKDIFQSMKNLEEIWIEKQKMPIVTNEYFQGLTKLKLLGLQNCNIKELAPDAFRSLTSLQKMAVPTNQIKILPDGIFKTLNQLENLQLPVNEIRNLSASAFDGLKKLTNLDLTGNKIDAIEVDTFLEVLPSLKTLVVRFYNMKCDAIKKIAESIKTRKVEVKNMNEQIKEFCR